MEEKKKYNSVNEAASELSKGTYTGTVDTDPPDSKEKTEAQKFENTNDAAAELSKGTYTGTVAQPKK